jgi:phage baseplate assembly protein W
VLFDHEPESGVTVSVEISVPFMLTSGGSIGTTTDPDTQVTQHVRSLVETTPGERVMMPDYGVSMQGFVFEPGVTPASLDITNQVQAQMAKWEPTVNVVGVVPVGDEMNGVVSVEVNYTRGPNAPLASPVVSTATVLVGGQVV